MHKNINMRTVFALMSMMPLAFWLAVSAQAQERQDLEAVEFVEVEDNQLTRQKYTFLQNLMLDESVIKQANVTIPTRITVGEVVEDDAFTFVQLEGPLYCGANNCQFAGYVGTGENTREVINISTAPPVYTQKCGNELALIFAGGGGVPLNVGKWVYNGQVFEFKESYVGLENVPKCP